MAEENSKTLLMRGKFNIRALLGAGPLQSLTIDEIQDDQCIVAAALDTYTMVLQGCTVSVVDCLNDTIQVPEVMIRNCPSVKLASIIKCQIMTVWNSTLECGGDSTILHVDGDLLMQDVTLKGFSEVKVNGTVFANPEELRQLRTVVPITAKKEVDISSEQRRVS